MTATNEPNERPDPAEPACLAGIIDDAEEPDDHMLAQLVRDLADAVVITDRTGTIVFWNRAATALLGWSAIEVAGKTLTMIVPPRLWDRHAAGFARVMETGETQYGGKLLEVPAVHRNGHTVSIAFTVTLLFRGGLRQPTGIAAVMRDDTAGRAARLAAVRLSR